jgi:hypothetical protein
MTAAASMMIEPVQLELFPVKKQGHYTAVYDYNWVTSQDGLPMLDKEWLDDHCMDLWGWHFTEGKMVLSFRNKHDLVQAKLCLTLDINK